jgi:hypothetical protein
MPALQTRQPGGLEVLQRLRWSIVPSTVPRIVPTLRDGQPGKGDRLQLVPRSIAGTQHAPVPSSLADVAGFLRRRPSRVVVGTAVVAAIAVIGYLADRQSSPADAREPAAASSAASSREAPADAGAIGRDAAAGDTESARADDNAPLTSPPVPPSGTPAKPAAITRPQAVRAGKAGEQREQSRPQACTEAVAALGLCTTKPVLKKEVTDARKPGGQEPPRSQTCTEAAAALGLCTPTIQQRRE